MKLAWAVLAGVLAAGSGSAFGQDNLRGKWELRSYECKSGKASLRSMDGVTDSLEIEGDTCTFDAKLDAGGEKCHVKMVTQCAVNSHLIFFQLGTTLVEGCKEKVNAEGSLSIARYEINGHTLTLAPLGSASKSTAKAICGDEADEARQIFQK